MASEHNHEEKLQNETFPTAWVNGVFLVDAVHQVGAAGNALAKHEHADDAQKAINEEGQANSIINRSFHVFVGLDFHSAVNWEEIIGETVCHHRT